MKIIIPGEFTDLNTYIDAERSNRFKAAKIKSTMTFIAFSRAKGQKSSYKRQKIVFRWYCKNQKKDPDNICFAKKFILDGMVKAGVIDNDGWKQISGFEDEFYLDKQHPRVEVELLEVEDLHERNIR